MGWDAWLDIPWHASPAVLSPVKLASKHTESAQSWSSAALSLLWLSGAWDWYLLKLTVWPILTKVRRAAGGCQRASARPHPTHSGAAAPPRQGPRPLRAPATTPLT